MRAKLRPAPTKYLLELGWLAKYCTDWKTADDRMIALNEAMANIDKDEVKPSQSASDGSWGGCISEWYRKLEPTVDELQSFLLQAGRAALLHDVPAEAQARALPSLATADQRHPYHRPQQP